MEEETTTNAPVATGAKVIGGVPVDDQGNALPDMQADTAAAESTTTEPSEEAAQNQTTTAPAASSDEDELATWAQNKGLELDSDNTRKVAKIARDNELAFKKKAQQASELERNVGAISDQVVDQNTPDGQNNEVLKRLQSMEVKAAVRDFWDANPEARALEPQMVEIVKQKPYLAGDLDVLYAYAKGKDTSTVRQDVLTDLAHKQQTAVPTGNATNTQTMSSANKITPQNVEQMVAKMSVAEYEKRLPEINAALAR